MATTQGFYTASAEEQVSYNTPVSKNKVECARMHVLHAPRGSRHLNERQDDDDYIGGGTGLAVNFGTFVKKHYERIVESARQDQK